MPWITQTSFEAGAVSPRLRGRTEESSPLRVGAREIEGFYITESGSLKKHGGSRLIGEVASGAVGDHTKPVFLIPFILQSGNYLCVFNGGKVQFIRDGGFLSSGGARVNASHGYTDAQLPSIQHAQSEETLYLSHGNLFPQAMTRASDTSWTLQAHPFETGKFPVYEVRTRDIALSLSSAAAGTGRTILSSESLFDSLWASSGRGYVIRINNGWVRFTNFVSPTEGRVEVLETNPDTADATTAWGGPYKEESTGLGGTLTNTVGRTQGQQTTLTSTSSVFAASDVGKVFRFVDGGTTFYGECLTFTDVNNIDVLIIDDNGGTTSGTMTALFRLNPEATGSDVTMSTSATSGTGETMTASAPYFTAGMVGGRFKINDGVVRITAVSSPPSTTATIDIEQTLATAGATALWEEGWNDDGGFPTAVTMHQGRLFYGGSKRKRMTFWGSKSPRNGKDRLDDFETGDLDSDGLQFTIAERGEILWMASQKALFIGAGLSEHVFEAVPITPGNFGVETHSTYGGKAVTPVVADGRPIFIRSNGHELRGIRFSFDRDRYHADNLNDVGSHVFEASPIKQVAYQRGAEIIWAVREDGELWGLSLRTDSGIRGWHKRTIGGQGTVDSIAVLPGSSGDDDLYVAVARTINGGTKRTIERIDFGAFMDGWIQDTAAGSEPTATITGTTVSGLDHLEGETVQVIGSYGTVNDDYLGEHTVSSGQVDVATETAGATLTAVRVGLPYTPKLVPEIPRFYSDGKGQVAHRVQTSPKRKLRVKSSLGLKADGRDLADGRNQNDTVGQPVPPYSGYLEDAGPLEATMEDDPTVEYTQEGPFDCEILSIAWEVASE